MDVVQTIEGKVKDREKKRKREARNREKMRKCRVERTGWLGMLKIV